MKKSNPSPTRVLLVALARYGINPYRTIAFLAMILSAQVAIGQMIGHEMQLDIRGPEWDNAPDIISYADFDPVTVGPEVEYHVGPEDSPLLARHSIDITDDSLLFDYSQCDCSGRFFRHDEFNGFILSDASGTLRPILNATVDEAETSNIRLTDDRISVSSDDVIVNVEGLSASSRSKFKIDLQFAWIGDANLDGEFNSGDFVQVFQAGKYETGEMALWSEGDWNADERFDSSDFVIAFQDGGYEMGTRAVVATVPEPSSLPLLMLGMLGIGRIRKR